MTGVEVRRFRTRRDDVAGCPQDGCRAPTTRLELVEGFDSLIDYTATATFMTLMPLPTVGGLVQSGGFLGFTSL